MARKYTQISEGIGARVHAGYLYVRITDMQNGMLIQGGRSDSVYRAPYSGTLEEAQKTGKYNHPGITDIDQCVIAGQIIREGKVIN